MYAAVSASGVFWVLILVVEMGKPTTKARVRGVCRSMPFQCNEKQGDGKPPHSMKSKQRQWMMDGLRAMKAPVVFYLKFVVFSFIFLLLGKRVHSKINENSNSYSKTQWKTIQVFATLVALLFQVEGLDWSKPTDHFECFAGDMSVTKAEWADT